MGETRVGGESGVTGPLDIGQRALKPKKDKPTEVAQEAISADPQSSPGAVSAKPIRAESGMPKHEPAHSIAEHTGEVVGERLSGLVGRPAQVSGGPSRGTVGDRGPSFDPERGLETTVMDIVRQEESATMGASRAPERSSPSELDSAEVKESQEGGIGSWFGEGEETEEAGKTAKEDKAGRAPAEGVQEPMDEGLSSWLLDGAGGEGDDARVLLQEEATKPVTVGEILEGTVERESEVEEEAVALEQVAEGLGERMNPLSDSELQENFESMLAEGTSEKVIDRHFNVIEGIALQADLLTVKGLLEEAGGYVRQIGSEHQKTFAEERLDTVFSKIGYQSGENFVLTNRGIAIVAEDEETKNQILMDLAQQPGIGPMVKQHISNGNVFRSTPQQAQMRIARGRALGRQLCNVLSRALLVLERRQAAEKKTQETFRTDRQGPSRKHEALTLRPVMRSVEGKKTISTPKTDVDRKRRRLEELAVGKRKEREQSEEVLLESQKENIDRKDKEVRKDERHYELKADFIKGDQKLE